MIILQKELADFIVLPISNSGVGVGVRVSVGIGVEVGIKIVGCGIKVVGCGFTGSVIEGEVVG